MFKKRGQATLIIFLAIVILAIIILIFYFKSKVFIGPPTVEDLRRELDPIIRHVEKCLYETTEEFAVLLGKQGGYLNPQEDTYRLYQDNKVNYLCYSIPKLRTCSNRYLRLADLESQLKQAINSKLNTCLKIKTFEKAGYSIIIGNKDLQVEIGTDNIITTLKYPVKIKKGDAEAEISVFRKAVSLPLGRLHSAARDIINSESIIGAFDPLTYSILKSKFTSKQYIVQRLQPYPDKLYILKIKDTPTEKDPYIFQFFIEGEDIR